MKGLEIKILYLGYLATIGEELVAGLGNKPFRSPVSAVLMRHPKSGYILYDTGNDDNWENTYSESIKKLFPVVGQVTIKEALELEGIKPDDINMLILSHLHFDHAGGLKFFQGTKAGRQVIVSGAELKDALYRVNLSPEGMSGAYFRKLFCGLDNVGFSPVAGRKEIAEGITLFEQHSHTAGVLGMEITLEEAGTLIFTGDTIYTKNSYAKLLPPGGDLNTSTKAFINNIEMIKNEEKGKNATVIFGHDPLQCEEWTQKGWIH